MEKKSILKKMWDKIKVTMGPIIKPIEFLFVVGIAVLAIIFGKLAFGWGVVLIAGYIVLQITGWATKETQDVIDDVKDIVEDAKKEIKELVEEIKEKVDEVKK